MAKSDLPSVAQTRISAVGCVANATGVDGWKVSSLLYGSGRIKESAAVGILVVDMRFAICDMRLFC